MNRISAAAALSVLALVVLVVALWHWIALGLVGYAGWRYVAHKAGRKRRPKSSWSSLLRSGAIAYGAWNTRWLKPKRPKASVPASADGWPARPEGWDR